MRTFKIEEISSCPKGAMEGAKAVLMKRAYPDLKKMLAVTTINGGHAHIISTFGPDAAEMRSGSTDYVQSTEDGGSHSHNWVTDESGNIIIADAAGHGHGLAALITKNDISPEEDPLADLLSKGNKSASVVSEDNTMTDEEKKKLADLEKSVSELTKRAEAAEKLAKLSDSEKSHLDSLEADKADEFLAKSADARKSEIEALAKADAVVFTDMDGVEYHKSDDVRMVAMAKRVDLERTARKDLEKRAEDADLAKAAESLSHLPGESADRIALMKGLALLGDEDKASALKCLKASEEAMAKGFDTLGTSSAPESGSPEAELDILAKTLRDKNPEMTEAEAMVKALETPEGLALYGKHAGLSE